MSKNNPAPTAEQQAKKVYAQAAECIKQQDFAKAEKYLVESMSITPTADAAHNLGTLRFMQNKTDEAIELFQQAFTLDAHYDAAYANLMRIFYQKGDIPKAMEYSAMAMTAAPQKQQHKEEFFKIFSNVKIQQATPDIKQLVGFCLEDETLILDGVSESWLHLIMADPDLAPIYALRTQSDFEGAFENLDDYKGLLARYFTLGLCSLKIPDKDFQTFLTKLRALILKDHIEDKGVLFDKNFIELIAALSVAARNTGFKLNISEREKKLLQTLRTEIDTQQDSIKNPKALCVLGSYEDIGTGTYAQKFADIREKSPGLKKFLSNYFTN